LTLAWTRYGKKELADGIESCGIYACLMKVIESCVSQERKYLIREAITISPCVRVGVMGRGGTLSFIGKRLTSVSFYRQK
jgi:hypothetical protein